MECYYESQPTTTSSMSTQPTPDNLPTGNTSILSEFNCHQLEFLLSQDADEGWQDLPSDVTKDTDIVKWWQAHHSDPLHDING